MIFPVDAPPVDVSEVREAAGDEDVLLPSDRAIVHRPGRPADARARVGRALRLAVDPAASTSSIRRAGLRLERAAAPALAAR